MPKLQCPHCLSERSQRAGFSRATAAFNERRRQRMRCASCSRRYAEHSWSLHYWLKKPDPALNAKIFNLCVQGLSNRRIAHLLYIGEHCVRLRIKRMAKQAMIFHGEFIGPRKITEDVCFDGLENFAGSQYDVNNIQQAVGSDSLFIYDFNLATMNRKGRMSEWQRNRLREIEAKYGCYNPSSIRVATRKILHRLIAKWGRNTPFCLLSDQHFQYRKVVSEDLRDFKIIHQTISSKACRNFQNILFPVNHVDLLIRKHMGAFMRETISFSKSHQAMCQKYALYMVYKNYMIAQFTKFHVRRPLAHKISPAQAVGYTDRLLKFEDLFEKRAHPSRLACLNEDWAYFVADEIPPEFHRCHTFQRRRRTVAA